MLSPISSSTTWRWSRKMGMYELQYIQVWETPSIHWTPTRASCFRFHVFQAPALPGSETEDVGPYSHFCGTEWAGQRVGDRPKKKQHESQFYPHLLWQWCLWYILHLCWTKGEWWEHRLAGRAKSPLAISFPLLPFAVLGPRLSTDLNPIALLSAA